MRAGDPRAGTATLRITKYCVCNFIFFTVHIRTHTHTHTPICTHTYIKLYTYLLLAISFLLDAKNLQVDLNAAPNDGGLLSRSRIHAGI